MAATKKPQAKPSAKPKAKAAPKRSTERTVDKAPKTAPPAPRAEAFPPSLAEPASAPPAGRDGTVVVVLDSSSLFLPFQFRVDPVAETKRILHKPLEFVVPGPVTEEIRRVLESGYGRSRRDAKAALQYAERFAHRHGRGQGDDAVLNMAVDERHAGRTAVIVTTDVGLRRRARAFHVPVLFMRSKGHLMLDGYIE